MKSLLLFLSCLQAFSLAASAAEAQIWNVNTRAEVLRGDARGVAVTDAGAITLAPKLAEVYNTGQSFVWSSAADSTGNVYLGTGSDGRIFKIDAVGKGALFFDSNELDVTALAIARDGFVFAATSPDGKIYRIAPDGKAETYFDPPDKYIWSLALMPDNSLAVGSGENGKIYRVRAAGATAETSLLFDSSETHVISLAVDRQGNLIAGTDANGLVLRISPEGRAFALLDAPLRELHQLAVAGDNSIYALALSETASSSGSSGGTVTSTSGTTVTVAATSAPAAEDAGGQQAQTPPRSRNDLNAAKSAVFRILPDGGNEIVWSSTSVTAFSVAANPNGNGVLIGTSDKGRIYAVSNDGRETLLLQSGEGQISTFAVRGTDVFTTSSNQGKLYRFGGESAAEGVYESSVRDAKSSALWGRIWWQSSGNVELQTRTGNTERPDATWSEWSAAYRDPRGVQITSPKARFLQWRAVLRNASTTTGSNVSQISGQAQANLNEVNVSYLPRNIAPEILSVQILPANVGLQSNVPPPTDPNIESSGLDPAVFGLPQGNIPPRRLYQRGARSLTWTAEDRNGDRLEYAVFYRSVNEQNFRLLKNGLRENFYTVDGAALADGRYIFRIAASDAPENPAGQSLTGERLSEAVDIDNTPPTVSLVGAPQVAGDRARVAFEVVDAASILQKAESSVDGKDWQTVFSDDGISDSPRERYTFELPLAEPGEHTISLRAFDANGNVGSFRVNVRR